MNTPIKLPDLVIPNGQTESNSLPRERYRFVEAITIGGPAALTGTVTVEVSLDEGTSFQALVDEQGNAVTVGVDEARVFLYGGWDEMRLSSSGAEDAERTFIARARE